MTSNTEAAEVFRRIADLLDVLGEKFKPEAYRRAARSLENLPESLATLAARNELRSVPGVGEAIEEKIRELLTTGKVAYLERLEREIPPGVVAIMRLPGLGPKTARRFWVELGIEGPAELRDAIDRGRLAGVKGFGDRKIAQIRESLTAAAGSPSGARVPIANIYPVARAIVAALRAGDAADRVEVAGSFRRGRETVGDLDILVTSHDPEKVFDRFSSLPEVATVRMRGGTKETVVLQQGLQVDLRVVEPAAFGAALQYFTGSKDHNVRLRSLARDRGLKVNEYGVFRGEERVAGATEEEVYSTFGLAWIPPELREDHGEIDAARDGKLPRLVTADDLVGDLHLHLPADATEADARRLGAALKERRLAYAGVVVGGTDDRAAAWRLADDRIAAVRAAAGRSVRVAPVLERGPGPLPPELTSLRAERAVLRPGSSGAEETSPPGGPPIWSIAHLSGSAETVRPWAALAARLGAAIEVGPGDGRADSTAARGAIDAGAPLGIPIGLGEEDPGTVEAVALGFARRAGAERRHVRNAAPFDRPTERGPVDRA